MKIGKKKLKEIYRYVSDVLDKKKSQELNKLYEEYQKKQEDLHNNFKREALDYILSNLDSMTYYFDKHWKGSYYIRFWLPDAMNKKFDSHFTALQKEYEEQKNAINKKYTDLFNKLNEWYDENYKKIVFGGVPDIPDWISEIVGL